MVVGVGGGEPVSPGTGEKLRHEVHELRKAVQTLTEQLAAERNEAR